MVIRGFLGCEIVAHLFRAVFRRIRVHRRHQHKAFHARTNGLVDDGYGAVTIDILGLFRRGMGAGAGREDHGVAAGQCLPAIAFQVRNYHLVGADRLHLVALGLVADHGPRLMLAAIHGMNQTPPDLTVGADYQCFHGRSSFVNRVTPGSSRVGLKLPR